MSRQIKNLNIVAITGVSTTLLIAPTMMDPINIVKLSSLLLGSALVLSLRFRQIDLKRANKFFKLFLILPIIFLSLIVMSSVINSQKIYSMLFGMWGRNNGLLFYLGIFTVFIYIILTNAHSHLQGISRGFFFLSSILPIYSWLQHWKLDPITFLFPEYNLNGVIALTVGNSNFASVLLGLTFSVALAHLFDKNNSNKVRIVALTSTLVHVSLLPYIDTQGKIVYALGGAFLVGIWIKETFRSGKLRHIWIFWWLSVLLNGVFGVTGLFGFGPFASMLENNVTNLKDRYYHWISAIRILREHMLFGVGVDSFGDWHRRFRVQESIDLRGTPMSGTDNAHNVYLQIGATVGLPALIVFLILIAVISFFGFRALQNSTNKFIVGMYFSVWIGYLVQALVSIDQIGISIWGWISAGILISVYLQKNLDESKSESTFKHGLRANNNKINTLTKLVVLSFLPFLITLPTLINENQLFGKIQKLQSFSSAEDFNNKTKSVLEEALKSKQPKVRITAAIDLGRAGAADKALLLAQLTSQEFPMYLESWHLIASIYESRKEFELALPARRITTQLDPLNTVFKDLLIEDESQIE